MRGNKSLCKRDCSKKRRGKIVTGPKKAVGRAEPVTSEGKVTILQAKARARPLGYRLGRGYLNRSLFFFCKRLRRITC